MFAKIFETKEHGQILVKIDTDEESNPEVRFYFEPEGLGVCSMAISNEDSDEGWKIIEKVFDKFDEEAAIKAVVGLKDELKI
jgi:uncharacterized protein YrzB (UPF0473 family)